MRKSLYPKLAWSNILRERKFYLPYLLTVVGTAAAFYIVSALAGAKDLPEGPRYAYLSMFMGIGVVVVGLFAVIFLTYTGSFLAKRRQRELGLYNILGMGKGHIGLVLGFESLYLALLGIGGGVLLGVGLQGAAIWCAGSLMRLPVRFGFSFSPASAVETAAIIGGVLLFNLLLNLRRVHAQKPAQLLKSQAVGEREPKTRWLLAAVGVATLSAGYGIALTTRSAVTAVALYFLAVILVIVGTYCLFTAVSIVVLKALRKNRGFYYKTTHFIGVSGMLYRMKRNGVGLANLCILCTMVLVMVSGTLTLYLGSEQLIPVKFPGEATLSVGYDPLEPDPLDPDALDRRFADLARAEGYAPERVGGGDYASVTLAQEGEGVYREYSAPSPGQVQARFYFFSYESYEALTGEAVEQDGKAHLYGPQPAGGSLSLDFGAGQRYTCPVGAPLPRAPQVVTALAYLSEGDCFVALPRETLLELSRTRLAGQDAPLRFTRLSYWDLGGDPEGQQAALDRMTSGDWSDVGSWSRLILQSRHAYAKDYYAVNGGFFFLGTFLGLLFLMATALILYYKQIAESYEDRERYQIMARVGMEDRDIRRSVNSQMGVVFFAPLLVAGVHVAFDFPLVGRLLTLFGVVDGWLFFLCTLGVFAGFALLYALLYRAAARMCYKLVR